MSRPTAMPPSPACSIAPTEPTVSASTTLAPPCSSPNGWVLPATGIRATTRCGDASRNSISMRSPSEPLPCRLSSSTSSLRPASSISLPIAVSVAGPRLPCVSRLLLIDGHSMAYRAFFALPVANFATTTGQPTNAVYGFTSMLINVLRDEQPTHVAVAFDVSRKTFRMEEYADYKATRSATPSEFQGQVALVREVLDALKIRHVQLDGFEADDVIAPLTTQATAQGMDVVICTGDRDAFQLVSDKVTLLYPVRGVSEVWRMDPKAVEEKYLVAPERYSDLAALVGETSDNLPGVHGVGPKTAAKWLGLYGDLQGVVAHAGQIKGKAGESLREHLNGVLRNRRLNHLLRDLELPVTIDELARQNWDREQVHTVFDSLEFRVLRDRLFEYLEAPQEEADHGFEVEGSVLDADTGAAFFGDGVHGQRLTAGLAV